MEKREFNKAVKQKLLSYGFEKTGPRDYAKEALDGITKIIVQVPDETINFCVGVQFKDFGKTYTDYSGKFSKRCMAYSCIPRDLAFTPIANCFEDQLVDMITTLMNSIEIFLQEGKKAIREHIDDWITSVISEAKENDIYTRGLNYLITILILAKCNCIVAGRTSGTVGAALLTDGWEYSYFFDLGYYE